MNNQDSKFTIDLSSASKDQLKSKLAQIEESFLKRLGEEVSNPEAMSGGTASTSSYYNQTHLAGGWLKS